MAREANILIRLSEDEKAAFEEAARVGGLSTSSWIRQKLRTAALEELRALGMQVAFLQSVDSKSDKNVTRGTIEERKVMPVEQGNLTSPESEGPPVGAIPEIFSIPGIRFTRPD